MAWTAPKFTTLYPEMADYPLEFVEAILADADDYIPSEADGPYGRMRERAVGLLAAHWLTLRVQQMSQNLGTGGATFGQRLDSTVYGAELARIQDGLPICGFVMGSDYDA